MEASYYWLISITTEAISVGLIKRGNPNVLAALGPETEWTPDNPDSFLHSVDISLSEAAQKAALEPEQEPEASAFILPPKWIGNDGKIFPEHLKLLENLCRSLKLKPLGFISNDEAFIESLNKNDSFPPSFILVYLGIKEFSLSLVHLGEVKRRFHQVLTSDFTPQDLENALATIQLDSALPPRIIVFGHLSPSIIDDLKNYSWIGKKNFETFLHLPDIESYQPEELFNLYCQTVSSQIEHNPVNPQPNSSPEELPLDNENIDSLESSEIIPDDTDLNLPTEGEPFSISDEVSPDDLGFAEINDSDSIVLSPSPSSNSNPLPSSRKFKLTLPKISLPKFHLPSFKLNPWLLLPLALSPLLLLLPYFLIKAEVVINFNPIEVYKDFDLTLDSTVTSISPTNIPVIKKTFEIDFTESLPTTGQKETGDKAKGEITIFNKIDKIQNSPKGTILVDSSGKKYELLTSVQIPASTYDLATGTITMGQTKANAIASDIGPEFNSNKDTLLSFSDNANLLGKVNDSLTGGTRRQVQVVAAIDKTNLTQTVTDSIESRISQRIASESSLKGLMPETAFIDKKQFDFIREVGEESDILQVNASLVVSVLQIDPQEKENILKVLFANDQELMQSVTSPSDFSFSFIALQNTSQKSTGKLTVTGKTLPKINIDDLRSRLSGQSFSNAQKIIDTQPRVYNRDLKITPSIFSFLKRLPPSKDKITIIQKF